MLRAPFRTRGRTWTAKVLSDPDPDVPSEGTKVAQSPLSRTHLTHAYEDTVISYVLTVLESFPCIHHLVKQSQSIMIIIVSNRTEVVKVMNV